MQSVPREWLDFLRQQFPKDSRIQLTEIGGNPRPISPGSTGKLDYIDDAGQFHVKWDNGCTLALVLGEDRFSVYLPEPQTFKLYMPLTADFYGRDEWGDMSEDGEEWDGHTLMDYEGQILSALVKNRVPEENESGLMRWYGEDDSVDHKVRSAVFTVEVRNRQLWGVAECRVAGELTPEELTILKEYLLSYLKSPEDYIKTTAEQYMRDNQEEFLAQFLKKDALLAEYQMLSQDSDAPVYRMRAITDALQKSGAKTVNVTVQKDGVELTFKTSAESLKGLKSQYSTWYIAPSDRLQFRHLFGAGSDYSAEDIIRIAYGRSTLYEAPSAPAEDIEMQGMSL